jgi:hypothetical protein
MENEIEPHANKSLLEQLNKEYVEAYRSADVSW